MEHSLRKRQWNLTHRVAQRLVYIYIYIYRENTQLSRNRPCLHVCIIAKLFTWHDTCVLIYSVLGWICFSLGFAGCLVYNKPLNRSGTATPNTSNIVLCISYRLWNVPSVTHIHIIIYIYSWYINICILRKQENLHQKESKNRRCSIQFSPNHPQLKWVPRPFFAAVTAQTPILHAWVRWLVQKAASKGAPALLGSSERRAYLSEKTAVDTPSPKLGKLISWINAAVIRLFDTIFFDVEKNSEKQCGNGENCKLHMLIDFRSAFCLCSRWSFFSCISIVWCRGCGCGRPSCCRFGRSSGCGSNRCGGNRCGCNRYGGNRCNGSRCSSNRCSGRCGSSLIISAGLGRRHAVALREPLKISISMC